MHYNRDQKINNETCNQKTKFYQIKSLSLQIGLQKINQVPHYGKKIKRPGQLVHTSQFVINLVLKSNHTS